MANLDLNKPLFQATLEDLIKAIEPLISQPSATPAPEPEKKFVLYNNESLKELLGVQDKLIKKYRDDGLLPFRKVGDKFWYTQEDVDTFLANNFFDAYAYEYSPYKKK